MKDLHEPLQGHLDLTALTQRIGAARTLHSVLGARPDTRQFRFDESHRLDLDVLVVDEASMVHLEMMVAVMKALPPRARLVLLGDKDQLASVEAGALLGDLCRPAEAGGYGANFAQQLEASSGETLPPSVVVPDADAKPLAQHIIMLRKSHRFGGPIGQLATAVNQGDAQAAAKAFDQDTNGALLALFGVHADKIVQLAVAEESGGDRASYQGYAAHVAQWPRLNDRNAADAVVQHEAWVKSVLVAFDRFRVLCAVREGPWGTVGLNQAIAQELTRQGLLQAHGEWYAGRPIMITRNDAVLGVFNGDIGVVLPALHGGAGLRAYFLDGEVLRSIAVSRLAHVESAFALTVHKSQGSEYAHAVVALPAHAGQLLSRELVYTGVTRAKRALTLVTEHTGLLASALQHATQRASGLLDFLEDETHVN